MAASLSRVQHPFIVKLSSTFLPKMRFLAICSLFGVAVFADTHTILTRRDDNCTAQPLGKGPVPSPDNSYEFLHSGEIDKLAKQAETPVNYTKAFGNLHASSSNENYLGYITLDSYDTALCAANCTEKSECQSINIFFERSPTVAPGEDCVNPPSTNIIKCAFWGSTVNEASATNTGHTEQAFNVVVAGSNGYYNTKAEDPQKG